MRKCPIPSLLLVCGALIFGSAAAFIPALRIARASNAIALTWTNEVPAMSVEQSAALASAWTAVTNAPALTASNTWTITLPLAPGTRLFRLRLQ